MVRILVDSAADYQMEEIKEKNLEMVPLRVNIGEESWKDEWEMKRGKLYDILLEGKSVVQTSQPSPQDFVEVFERVRDAGDELVCVLLSSAVSGTYQSACLAKEIVDYDGIYLVDSRTATIAEKILADFALSEAAKGTPAKEIAKKLEELKGRVHILVALDTLKFLAMGGRISRTAAAIGNAANLRPAIELDKEGKVVIAGKYLGTARAVKEIVKHLEGAGLDPDYPLYLVWSKTSENMEKLKKHMEEASLPVDGCYEIGSVIGVHVGPGAFGAIYVTKE